jgi:hypothetical protein
MHYDYGEHDLKFPHPTAHLLYFPCDAPLALMFPYYDAPTDNTTKVSSCTVCLPVRYTIDNTAQVSP